MDKLPEPEFGRDANWPRKVTGVKPLLTAGRKKSTLFFFGLSALSLFRYHREVTFYKKNYPVAAGVTFGFLFASYNIAKFLAEDPFVLAAEENNKREQAFIDEYLGLYHSAREKGLVVPNEILA